MDGIIAYALMKSSGFKGSVASSSDLPADAKDGTMYLVGSDLYVKDGTWKNISAGSMTPITEAQIRALFA